MNILVGDLAKLFGISSQSLHYYEKIGVLNPQKDIINEYRYYDLSDFSKLGALRKLRNADFSLDDSISIFNSTDYTEVAEKYLEKKNDILKEIEKKQQIIEKLDKATALYKKYKEIGSEITIETLPPFLRFESADTHIIFQNRKMRTEAIPWFVNILHTFSCQMYYYDDKEFTSFSYFTHGMIADAQTVEYLNLGITENVTHIEGGKFISCLFECEKNTDYITQIISNCIDYAKQNGKKIRANPCAMNIFSYQDKKFFNQILIPIY